MTPSFWTSGTDIALPPQITVTFLPGETMGRPKLYQARHDYGDGTWWSEYGDTAEDARRKLEITEYPQG